MIQFLSKHLKKINKNRNRKNFLIVFFLLIATSLQAKTYFVSATGNNSNTGLTEATSWQTISKVNSFSFATNDIILFKRGDVFYGSITIRQHNLTYGAYGTGAKPVISGLSTVTGWVNRGGNIWEAPTTNVKATNNLVLRNSKIQQIGRYPNADAANKGYLVYTAATTSSITGPASSSVTNWKGAEVAIRINKWEILRKIVTTHSAGVVSFAAHSTAPRLNFGYFFQRDPRTLDQDGEWWQDGTNNKLRMYFSNNNPTAYTIQASTVDILISNSAGYFRNVSIRDLSFNGAGKIAIYILSGVDHTVTNCDVNNSAKEAINILSASNVKVDKCNVRNSLGSGIQVSNNSNLTLSSITNCTVDSTAMIAGMETSNEFNGGNGILNRAGSNVYITYCKVTNSGYVGIAWFGNNTFIKYNLVDTYCKVREDGAGIYTAETMDTALYPKRYNRNVVSNIVINGIGQNKGTNTPNELNSVCGIYVDDGAADVLIDSNTVAYIPKAGIHGNNNQRIIATNNTTYNTGSGFSTQRLKNGKSVTGMRITKNIFYPYRFAYANAARDDPNITILQSIKNLGTVDSNYYSLRAGTDTSMFEITVLKNGTGYIQSARTIDYLKGTVGFHTHSTYVADNTGRLEYNAGSTPRTVTFSGLSKKDVFGNVYNNSVTIPAWSSKVLIPNGTATTLNKAPLANAGTSKVVTLPTNSLSLSGTGSDTDGTIAGFAWVKIAGPTAGTILSPAAASTTINSLIEGIYQYELKVTDNSGAIGKDTIQVTVNALAGGSLMKAAATQAAVNCTATSSFVTVSATGGVSPYSGTGSFNTNAGKGALKISFPSVSTIQTTIYASVGQIIAGKTYVLRFSTLGTSNNAQISIQLKKYITPFTALASPQTTTFGASIKNHQILFKPTVSDAAARIDMWFTQNSGTTYLDNLAFFEATPTGELISSNVVTKGQFEADISAVRFWSSNRNQLIQWDNTSKIGNINYYTVTDAAGTKSTAGLAVNQPAVVLKAAVSSGASNVLTVSASGGASPYTGTGAFTAKLGTNTFIVTDANGCSNTASISITQLTAARISTATTSTVTPVLDAATISNTLKISSYPNPTTSTFKLLVEGKINEKINVVVMSEDGRIVFQTAGVTNKTYEFGSNFVRGLYIIKVIQGINIQTLKVIKI